MELTAGGEIGDGAAVSELPRMNYSYHSNQRFMVRLTVLAPPPDGRRRRLDGEAERRRGHEHGAAGVPRARKQMGQGRGFSSSPEGRRA